MHDDDCVTHRAGPFDLTPEQIESLERGRWYVQIHSQKGPDGNLWGWLLK